MLDDARVLTPEHRASQLERILALKRLPTIGDLHASELAVIAEEMRERFHRKGAVVLLEGVPVDATHFVVEGRLHVARADRAIGHAGPGGAVGAWSILGRDPRGLTAVAETDTITLELRAEAMTEIFEDFFGIYHHVLKDVCGRLLDLIATDPEVLRMSIRPNEPRGCPECELDLVERIFFMRQVDPFRKASVNALAELSRALTEVRLPAGHVLWSVGDRSDYTTMIVNGEVDLTAAGGARFHVGGGSPLGTLESIAERPRWFTAVTTTPVVALNGPTQGLLDVFEDNFEMAMDFMAVMARWMVEAYEKTAPDLKSFGQVHGCTLDDEGAH